MSMPACATPAAHEGKTDGIAPEVVEKIQKQISTMTFKKELLNLPKFMPL